MRSSGNADRRRDLLAYTRSRGRTEVSDLAAHLGVASETVRRDLTLLARQGLLRRTHGAAHPVDNAGFETTLKYRSGHLVPQKRTIARAAVELIGAADSLYLDDGYTPGLIAADLAAGGRRMTVITPSIPVAITLARSDNISVIILGGSVRHQTLGIVGHWTTDMLSTLLVDVAVVGANGISTDRGLSTPDPAVSAVKTAVLRRATRKVFVGVHTKFGVDSFSSFADVAEFEALITDRGLSSQEARRYAELGPHVIRT